MMVAMVMLMEILHMMVAALVMMVDDDDDSPTWHVSFRCGGPQVLRFVRKFNFSDPEASRLAFAAQNSYQ